MKITLEPTETIRRIDGVETRLWTGFSEAGSPCSALLAAISVGALPETQPFLFSSLPPQGGENG